MLEMKNRINIFKNEKGVTFVEIMLAVAILAIIAVPLLSTVIATFSNNATAKEKTEAIALAEMAMGEIKAQSALAETTPPAIGISTDKLVSYHSIEFAGNGQVVPSKNTAFNYNIPPDSAYNFELLIDPGSSTNDGRIDSVTLIDKDGKNPDKTFNTIYVADKKIEFQLKEEVVNSSSKYYYIFSYDSDKVEYEFTPKSSIIKLKITYKNNQPSSYEQLKINTKIYRDNIFEVYDNNNEEANAGVLFIPRGKEFTVNYIKNNAFSYGAINSLYKITVKILKKSVANSSTLDESTLDTDDIIYEASSYVKK